MSDREYGARALSRRAFLGNIAIGSAAALLAACTAPAAPAAPTAPPAAKPTSAPAAAPPPAAPTTAPAAKTGAAPPAGTPAAKDARAEEWQRTLEAARREGEVSVYAGSGQPNREAMGDPFEKAYPGIKVNLTIAPPADLLARINAERTAGRFLIDVLPSFGGSALVPLKPVGALAPLEPAFLHPEVTDKAAWLENRYWWLDTSEPNTTLAFVGNVQSPVVYNKTMVDPSEFKSYTDLLNPKWKGKIASNDIRRPGPGAVPTRFLYKHPELGPEFIDRLFGDMDVTLNTDLRQLYDWIGQGRYPLGLLMLSADILIAIEQGLPIGVVPAEQFKEGAPIGPAGGTLNLIENAPHPNAARVFVNWMLSKDGQMTWQQVVKDNSLRTDIPKQGIPDFYLTKPSSKYVFAATEDYARLSTTVIGEVVNKAQERAGKS